MRSPSQIDRNRRATGGRRSALRQSRRVGSTLRVIRFVVIWSDQVVLGISGSIELWTVYACENITWGVWLRAHGYVKPMEKGVYANTRDGVA
nr:hypothetical protein CFP56_00537 [Quercus suber]